MTIYKFYNSPKNCILCFDGIMLLKNDNDYKITECQKYIYDKLDINISLKIKEMDEGLHIDESELIRDKSNDKELYIKIKKEIENDLINNDVNDMSISKKFVIMVKDSMKITDDSKGNGYIWDSNTKLWQEKDNSFLMLKISDNNNIIMMCLNDIKTNLQEKCYISDDKKKLKKN